MPAAFITGGGSGLGLAIARAVGAMGLDVGIFGRSEETLELARRALAAEGIAAFVSKGDVRRPRDVSDAARNLEAHAGHIDLAVHSAGTLCGLGTTWGCDEAAWRGDLETAVLGAYHVIRACVPGMVERNDGRVVIIASGAAFRPSPFMSGYVAAKAAVVSLVEAFAAEVAGHGITAFAVAPGFVKTALTDHLVASGWDYTAGDEVPAERTGALVARIAAGDADLLSGRVLHALDDLDELLRSLDDIERDQLYVPRVRRLSQSEPSSSAGRQRSVRG